MANLFWKQKNKTLNLASKPFDYEETFEKVVFDTKELFEDLYFLKRQVRGGNKSEIPDIIAIDTNGSVCIIEMKRDKVDADIIPQVLKYAIWAKTYPDSIRSLLLQKDDVPDDIQIDWEDYSVRIMVIAPEIDPSTLKFVGSISFPVELIEIKRWVVDKDEFLLVNKLEAAQSERVRTTRGLETYDRKFYEGFRNKKSVGDFLDYANETEKILKKNKIDLDTKFNKYYCGFKYDFFVAFSIAWEGSKSFSYRFHLPENVAKRVQGKLRMDKYYRKRATYNITPGVTKVKDFLPLMKKSLDYMKEERG